MPPSGDQDGAAPAPKRNRRHRIDHDTTAREHPLATLPASIEKDVNSSPQPVHGAKSRIGLSDLHGSTHLKPNGNPLSRQITASTDLEKSPESPFHRDQILERSVWRNAALPSHRPHCQFAYGSLSILLRGTRIILCPRGSVYRRLATQSESVTLALRTSQQLPGSVPIIALSQKIDSIGEINSVGTPPGSSGAASPRIPSSKMPVCRGFFGTLLPGQSVSLPASEFFPPWRSASNTHVLPAR